MDRAVLNRGRRHFLRTASASSSVSSEKNGHPFPRWSHTVRVRVCVCTCACGVRVRSECPGEDGRAGMGVTSPLLKRHGWASFSAVCWNRSPCDSARAGRSGNAQGASDEAREEMSEPETAGQVPRIGCRPRGVIRAFWPAPCLKTYLNCDLKKHRK